MTDTTVPTPVAILAGGRSPEHQVSLDSAGQLVAKLRSDRWQAWLVRLDRKARTWWVRREPAQPGETGVFDRHGDWIPMHPGLALSYLQDEIGVAIAFPVLHGPGGEDGTVQGMLTLVDMPFVGSGVGASAVAMDKIRTRECFAANGIPMAKAYLASEPLARVDPEREVDAVAKSVGFPCFAKVDTSGSSLGVERVNDEAGLRGFISRHRDLGRRYVVEAAVAGEEISVPVLGNSGEPLDLLPPIGIYPVAADHFSFDAKYRAGGSEETVPPRGLDAAMIGTVQELARRCHIALQCDGMSRTDMIVGADGPVVLEVNTIPGLTEASLLPKCAAHHGISFPELLDRLLEAGLRRWGRV